MLTMGKTKQRMSGWVVSVVGIAAFAALAGAQMLLQGMRTRLEFGGFLENRPQYGWYPGAVLDSSPFFGFGLGVFPSDAVDSDYLIALIQFGVIGLIAALSVYWYAARLSWGASRWAFGAVMTAAVFGLTNGVLFGNELAPFVLLCIGFGISGGDRDKQSVSESDPVSCEIQSQMTHI